jgi:nucleoside-diphosphate-sugar epimerase
MYKSQLLIEDIKHIEEHSQTILDDLKNKHILITGASGFFGQWFCQTLTTLNQAYELNLHLHVLSRSWESFHRKHPQFFDESITHFIDGDIRSFQAPDSCDFVIHMANEARPHFESEEDKKIFIETLRQGDQHLAKILKQLKPQKMLLTSSGAVYGPSFERVTHWQETDTPAPKTTYGEEKARQEHFFLSEKPQETDLVIMRCFAFIGPFLPLNGPYAAGHFLSNLLKGETIHVKGTGRPLRSYMYMSDLMIWSLKLLIQDTEDSIYNVGSEEPVSIAELASEIASLSPEPLDVVISQKDAKIQESLSYLPNTQKVHKELDLKVLISRLEALKKTLKWHRDCVG